MIRDYSHIAIKLSGISKRYTIHHEKPTLVERLAKGKDEEFWALKDINLTIRKGERMGLPASPPRSYRRAEYLPERHVAWHIKKC